jgi:hypothetical protein
MPEDTGEHRRIIGAYLAGWRTGWRTYPPGVCGLAEAKWLRFSGGAKGTRTPDPHTASVVRYQLRHSPRCCAHRSYTTVCQPSKSLVTRLARLR